MDNKLTVLEEIVKEITEMVYEKWKSLLPEDQKTPVALETLQTNTAEFTLFVIQNFINKFNEAAAELTSKPEENASN